MCLQIAELHISCECFPSRILLSCPDIESFPYQPRVSFLSLNDTSSHASAPERPPFQKLFWLSSQVGLTNNFRSTPCLFLHSIAIIYTYLGPLHYLRSFLLVCKPGDCVRNFCHIYKCQTSCCSLEESPKDSGAKDFISTSLCYWAEPRDFQAYSLLQLTLVYLQKWMESPSS